MPTNCLIFVFVGNQPSPALAVNTERASSIFLVISDPGSNGNLLLIYILPGAKLSARPIWFNCFLNFGIQNSFYIHHQNFNGSVLMQNISRQLGSQKIHSITSQSSWELSALSQQKATHADLTVLMTDCKGLLCKYISTCLTTKIILK